MFGTIARVHVKPGMKEALKAAMQADNQAVIPGWIADYLFESTEDPGICFLVAFFQDQESYTANADSAAQHERYLRFRACLSENPEWNDGHVISATGPGAHPR
jgi:hypothetical protein